MADIGHPTPAGRGRALADLVMNMAQIVQAIMRGETNNTGTVTLTENTTTTTVTDQRVHANSDIFLTPKTASAVSMEGLDTYISSIGDGTFTITHVNAASTDRTFGYAVHG